MAVPATTACTVISATTRASAVNATTCCKAIPACTGETGADTFVFAAGHGNDTIKYFRFGDDEDLIDLSQITGISGFDDLTITANNGDAVIDLTAQGGSRIRLESISVNDLDAEDFRFYETPTDTGAGGI